MEQNEELTMKEQIILLIEMIDEKNERLMKKLFRIANQAVVNGRID